MVRLTIKRRGTKYGIKTLCSRKEEVERNCDITLALKVNKRSPLTVQCKIGAGIAALLSALVVAMVLVFVLNRPEEQEYWLPQFDSSSKLGVFQHAAISVDASACAPIARQMLERNGSAVDAAIATLLCMGVVNPQSMGIGGGFLMTVYKRSEEKAYFIDAREVAPRKAFEDMFDGNSTVSEIGPLSIAVPGELSGYETAHRMFGNLDWRELFEPTIKMCKEGVVVTKHLEKNLKIYAEQIKQRENMRRIFINNETGDIFHAGDIIYRPDLASTLRTVADEGAGALYHSGHPLSQAFLSDLKAIGSIIDAADLELYEPRVRPPIEVRLLNNQTLYTAPIPGSGSLLAFMLNVLDGYGFSPNTAKNKTEALLYVHRLVETFKFAFSQRAQLEDDINTAKPVLDKLLSPAYADFVRNLINDTSVLGNITDYGFREDHGTAQMCIVAPNGDAVSVTSTVNVYFGSLEMSPSTGILLNDEMDDFSSPNVVSFFDLEGTSRNRIRPGRRPLSSMCPSIVVDSNKNARLVIGANGGTKIPTAVLQVMLRNLLLGENIKHAIDAPRLHHQLTPNIIKAEDKFPKDFLEQLQKMGHEVRDYGNIMMGVVLGITREADGLLYANSDYRKDGDIDGF